MQHERRALPSEVRLSGDTGAIEGYAARFYDGSKETEFRLDDDTVERIMPTAFDSARKSDVRALFNHDPSQLLGRTRAGTLHLSIDSRGLKYRIVPAETSLARDVRELVRRGDISGSSFGFRVSREGQRWRSDGKTTIRELTDVELVDVSPVTFPAYEGTTAEARSLAFAHRPEPLRSRALRKAREIELDRRGL